MRFSMRELAARISGLLLLAWCLFLLFPAASWAQQDDTDRGSSDSSRSESSDDGSEESLDSAVNFGAIDDLLDSDEEALGDSDTYTYDPGGRRDPFRSLLQRQRDDERPVKRPEGIPGLLIDELRIEGIFVLDDGPVAQVKSASQTTSFLLRPGDELWDGDVVSITLDAVVFKQSVNDPNSLKPFRDVTRKLNPAKRN